MSEHRQELIAGLRELADLLEANPDLPVHLSHDFTVHALENDDTANGEIVTAAARTLGVTPSTTPGGHYVAQRMLTGRVSYRVVAVPRQQMQEHRDLMSYQSAFARGQS